MTEAPYLTEFTTSTSGWKTLKAVVTTTDGSVYERLARFQVLASTTKREPYNEVVPEVPGTIMAEEFDLAPSTGVVESGEYAGVSTNPKRATHENKYEIE